MDKPEQITKQVNALKCIYLSMFFTLILLFIVKIGFIINDLSLDLKTASKFLAFNFIVSIITIAFYNISKIVKEQSIICNQKELALFTGSNRILSLLAYQLSMVDLQFNGFVIVLVTLGTMMWFFDKIQQC